MPGVQGDVNDGGGEFSGGSFRRGRAQVRPGWRGSVTVTQVP